MMQQHGQADHWAARLVTHGGTDSGPPPRFDFSSNANPLPAPAWLQTALQQADRRHYPDPQYLALRSQLGRSLGVDAARVVVSAGSSEAIRRLTLGARLVGLREVWVPQPGYGDYSAAAMALGLQVRGYASGDALVAALQQSEAPALVWLCEPNNPDGSSLPPAAWQALQTLAPRHVLALDRAYEALRLHGSDPVPAAVSQAAFSLWSPNKALGHTGIRAGCLSVPAELHAALARSLDALAPSWVLSAEGVALLGAWASPACATWLAQAREVLRHETRAQQQMLAELGWVQRASVTPFWLAQPPRPAIAGLRAQGLRLRDAESFGLPGWVRLSTQPREAQTALREAWLQLITPALTFRSLDT